MVDSFPVGAHWDSYRNDEKRVSGNAKDPLTSVVQKVDTNLDTWAVFRYKFRYNEI